VIPAHYAGKVEGDAGRADDGAGKVSGHGVVAEQPG
jgi:hypothetical protein